MSPRFDWLSRRRERGGGVEQFTLLVVVSLSKTTGCLRSCHHAAGHLCRRSGLKRMPSSGRRSHLPALVVKVKKKRKPEGTPPISLTCPACSVHTTLTVTCLARPCECDPSGSVGDCSPSDGGCDCKANVEGQSCGRFVERCRGNRARFPYFCESHIFLFFG